jgi:hypothetical protein
VDNLNSTRCEVRRNFRNKKREYLRDKINGLAMNSKNKSKEQYGGINKFNCGYQPTCNLVRYENGDLLADSHSILNMWKNCFSVIECA